MNLPIRPRRNRRSAAIRALMVETRLDPSQLVWPVFIHDAADSQDIPSLPHLKRLTVSDLLRECETLLKLNVSALALFPAIEPSLKNDTGSEALNPDNLVNRVTRVVKKNFPGLTLIADVALDPYTTHGHDGLPGADGDVANDATVDALTVMAQRQAEAGIDYVAPSDMMDGRVGAIRRALDADGHSNTGI
ncbi:MAG: porphobilinogen synthase, partial [Verrucomicrobiales bacterium]|nr:porphobilinogen synthase [Verrucomicrobiales bacterium]